MPTSCSTWRIRCREVVGVIHQNPLTIPNFLRSAKSHAEQWELLQKQVEQMTEEQ